MFHSGIFSCSKKPKSRKLTEHPSDPLNFQAREKAEPNLCLQGMGKNSTHLFNFIQPFLILGQLGHEGLVLQPFLMKLLGLVSAAVPRHQHLFTHPVPQLCKWDRQRRGDGERERCQYWMSVHTVNNSQYRHDFLHVQSLHQNEYIPWLLTIILSLWYGISSIHEDIT